MSGPMLTIGSLFAGIGGLELGLERAGLGPVIWQVEQDDYARRVLAKHWPGADRSVTDVREASRENLRPVDVICGGFPCTDISVAGRKAGIDGEQSGLWREYARIVGELRPRFVVVENVVALRRRGLARVVGDLESHGYVVAEPLILSAADVGAPHIRERLFLLAHADGAGQSQRGWSLRAQWGRLGDGRQGGGQHGERRSPATASEDAAGHALRAGRKWPTPTASPAGYSRGGGAGRVGPIRPSLNTECRPLNPEWVECLMGFPMGWTEVES